MKTVGTIQKLTDPPSDSVALSMGGVLAPIAAFQEWKRYHSVDALRRNPHNRSYIVGYYSCPRQVGVQFNDFLNSLLQAVISNRTFLYEYSNFAGWNSAGVNTPEACHRLVERATWIPSYTEWKKKINLPNVVMSFATNIDPHNKTVMFEKVDRGETVHEDVSHIPVLTPERTWGTSSVTEVSPGVLKLDNHYASTYFGQMYNIPNLARTQIVRQLYSEGVSFLYGMMLHEVFPFTKEVLDAVQHDLEPPKGINPMEEVSIAVHSRHPQSTQDGKDVSKEVRCLDYILNNLRSRDTKPCALYVMADRDATIELLTKYAASRQCRVVKASTQHVHRINDTSKTAEHGPFAGAGYFLDLAVVSHARTAIVATRRSSSALVDELIEYHRRMEAWESKSQRLSEPIIRCYDWHPRQKRVLWRKIAKSFRGLGRLLGLRAP